MDTIINLSKKRLCDESVLELHNGDCPIVSEFVKIAPNRRLENRTKFKLYLESRQNHKKEKPKVL